LAKTGQSSGNGAIVGAAIASILAAGLGAGAGWSLSQGRHDDAGRSAAPAASTGALPSGATVASRDGPSPANGDARVEAGASPPPPTTIKTLLLPPILTVVANPRNTWLRLEIAVLAPADEHGVEEQLGQLGDDMLSYLRTIEVSQIEGPSGLRFLKDDLLERARTRTNGQVQDIVIRTLVLE
jgi:flagellar protein FliL